MGLMGHSGEEEAATGGGTPLTQAQSELGEGAAPFPSLPLPFLPYPTPTRERGILLPPGVGLPPWARLGGRPSPPPPLLHIRGRGHPIDTQVDH